ncbi:MAG: hypothetical protein LBL99_04175, partial [Holosporaceae bacterium]|nr:hypothetical protein [Holosporaceae bacterium]
SEVMTAFLFLPLLVSLIKIEPFRKSTSLQVRLNISPALNQRVVGSSPTAPTIDDPENFTNN